MHQPLKILNHALLYSLLFICSCNKPERLPGKVYIAHEKGTYILYRNGIPFHVRGGAGYTNMEKLKAIGGNTIRTWDTTGLGIILDQAAANNLAVIAGLPIPESRYLDYFYKDTEKVKAQYTALRTIIRKYRSHPALLMWCLGNEVDFPYRPRYKKFYDAFNQLTEMIHMEDPDHPVTTTIVNFQPRNILNLRMKVRGIDVISFNTFGALKVLQEQLRSYRWLWNGPFLITEWGISSPQETRRTAWGAPIEPTSTWKADKYREFHTKYLPVNNPRCLGALTFYWGQKEEVTPTWYSLFDSSGATTGIVAEMQRLWTGTAPAHYPPALEYLLLNGVGAASDILTEPGRKLTVELKMKDTISAGFRFNWEVLKEELDPQSTVRPRRQEVGIIPESNTRITFRAPQKEGPYRVYVWVHDEHGNISTANIPFYVVEIPNENKNTRLSAQKN